MLHINISLTATPEATLTLFAHSTLSHHLLDHTSVVLQYTPTLWSVCALSLASFLVAKVCYFSVCVSHHITPCFYRYCTYHLTLTVHLLPANNNNLMKGFIFVSESCVMQVLFRLVPTNCTSLSFRTFLCSNLVGWLAGLIFQQKHETVWMRAIEPPRECSCKAKLIHTLVTVLYESFNDLHDLHTQGM